MTEIVRDCPRCDGTGKVTESEPCYVDDCRNRSLYVTYVDRKDAKPTDLIEYVWSCSRHGDGLNAEARRRAKEKR